MTPVPVAREGVPSDAMLVVRLRAGDGAAFEALFRRHYTGLFRFAWRLTGAAADAEEVVQDVFVAIWAQRATWAPTASVSGYLYAAVRNRVQKAVRHARVEERYAEQVGDAQTEPSAARVAPAADHAHGAAELRAAVHRTLAALPERCRLTFLLNREQGLSYAQVAEALGVSVKTVETQIARALVVLRRELGDWMP